MRIDRRNFLGAASTGAAAAALPGLATAQNSGAAPPPGSVTLGVRPPAGRGPLDARSRATGSPTNALADYVVGLSYDRIDAATLTKAKHRALDLIGCAIGGAPADGNAALARLAKASGGAPEASVIGYPVKGPAAEVAMTNAVISRSFDYEVMTVVVRDHEVASHHSPTTCMTALALCEQRRLTGKDFLAALVVGDDVAARTLAASGLDFGQGWDGSPLYGGLSGAAIASRLLGLTADQTRYALGLVVDQTGGTIQSLWDGGTSWKLGQGAAARSAVFSARLAK